MKINSIQYLRGVAALLVVYCHTIDNQLQLGTSWQQNFRYLQNFGAIGVDVFFVISGFIISYISLEKGTGIKEGLLFLKKRFLRINPSYYIATIIGIYIYKYLGPGVTIPKETLLNSVTIIPLFGKDLPWLGVAWTLIFEWFFYLIFVYINFLYFNKKKTNNFI
jgi:exopolysaccharide production protein ExoZ